MSLRLLLEADVSSASCVTDAVGRNEAAAKTLYVVLRDEIHSFPIARGRGTSGVSTTKYLVVKGCPPAEKPDMVL